MNCADHNAHRALDELMSGELSDSELTSLRNHAGSCRDCREQYDRISRAEAYLEGSRMGLPRQRLSYLEGRVLSRAAEAERPVALGKPSFWESWRAVLAPTGVLAAAGLAAAVWVVPNVRTSPVEDGYQARGGEAVERTWGVRAFCVAPGAPPQVKAEAAPGGTLQCPPGLAVAFSYTAPKDARLVITAPQKSGEPLRFLSAEEPAAQVKAGVDVPLSFSTPVSQSWLSEPLEVKARFEDPNTGELLGETVLQLTP